MQDTGSGGARTSSVQIDPDAKLYMKTASYSIYIAKTCAQIVADSYHAGTLSLNEGDLEKLLEKIREEKEKQP